MIKRLQQVGNSSGLIIDKPILELLQISPDTELDMSTDGDRLIITPLRSAAEQRRRAKFAQAHARVLEAHAPSFRKLAK